MDYLHAPFTHALPGQDAASDDFYVRAGTRDVFGDQSQEKQEGRRKRHR